MNLTPKLLALGMALFSLAPAADAAPGDWGIRVGKRTSRGGVSVHAGSRGYGVDMTRGRSSRSRGHVHGSCCNYTPGHYEDRCEQVWVPGCTEKIWVPAQIEVTYDHCGHRVERVVRPGYWDYIQQPGRYEMRQRRVWVPASYQCGGGGITSYRTSRRGCR